MRRAAAAEEPRAASGDENDENAAGGAAAVQPKRRQVLGDATERSRNVGPERRSRWAGLGDRSYLEDQEPKWGTPAHASPHPRPAGGCPALLCFPGISRLAAAAAPAAACCCSVPCRRDAKRRLDENFAYEDPRGGKRAAADDGGHAIRARLGLRQPGTQGGAAELAELTTESEVGAGRGGGEAKGGGGHTRVAGCRCELCPGAVSGRTAPATDPTADRSPCLPPAPPSLLRRCPTRWARAACASPGCLDT